jgi:hypothetical protein
MKKRSNWLAALPLLCCMAGCVCPAGTVKVNPAASAPPEVFWEVTKESPSGGPGLGTAISKEVLTDAAAHLTVPAGYKVSVVLKGKDSQTGIKTLKMKGRFGFTCKNAAGAEMAGDGFVPEKAEPFAADAQGCVPIEAAHSPFSTEQPCKSIGTLVESSYFFQGEAESHAGLTKATSLVLSFKPSP